MHLDPRPSRVAGRERLLTDLRARLSDVRGVSVVALCGLGGMGKTTAALEYAYRHLADYRIVWFFHAEQATDLLTQFHELAQLLGVPEGASPVSAVHAVLAAYPGRWLLVFDNVKDHAAARSWLPAKGSGHVLVTTQDGLWPREQAMEVSTLDAQTAAGFLLDRTMSTDAASAHAIAQELGLLPLALEQAAAFVETTGRSLAQYRELLRANHRALLERGAPSAHGKPVAATLSLALAELETDSPGSSVLLRIAAFLAPEDIPFRTLLPEDLALPDDGRDDEVLDQVRALCTEPLALDDAVAGLRRLSLIGPPSEVFSVHRLVQAVARDQIPPPQRDAWLRTATALVEHAVPEDARLRSTWPISRLLLPHAALVVDPRGHHLWRLASALGYSGDYATARTWSLTVAQAREDAFGPEHIETLDARHNLAYWTGEAGDSVTARDMFAQLLPISERLHGAEHAYTLIARQEFARLTGEAGDPATARDMFAELVPVRERVLGAEHTETLMSRHNLAYWTGAAGDATAARDMLVDLVPLRERTLGPEHPDTLAVRNSLAYWTGEAGDPATARDMLTELLPFSERILGPEHPETLAVLHNISYSTGMAGDAAAALAMMEGLVPFYERVLGSEHPYTRGARRNLAHWTRLADDR
ncbi:tetratricopeptide repeat protein [Actinospica durhamensis]|uniref:Tetratricopeptide repeat protein n=1 Tax=Actinospica durhamensis TaxID=1508375 RepID=A0A941IQW9_9ACTN|nr:tetratricopeptide repeat protein [Actinospica durhamensis]MBR7834672.1 tetratricopeptide repeat protein [Actinospica durhamensis]